jgi:hypothetical protein
MHCFKILIALLFMTLPAIAVSVAPFRIIMVHSYHHGFEWTDSVDEGFEKGLSKYYRVQVVSRYYLDAKKNPSKIHEAAESILKELKNTPFDLLFITDDDAMKNVGVKYINSNKYLVFAGINNSLSE